ncbi:NUDIX hydrolase [Pararhizobium mangrovi]|uniref:NUDIX hydrolase n=1 Tax=Pararhizobium mangrovi TaxID=2590452 RepID=A0A506UHY4_9HYPH|nr:NUDIX hydrolase [Pararhizobium mangrovi]TPW32922.1 NUDIX hydrolase [Pararhizobium mangrovi]
MGQNGELRAIERTHLVHVAAGHPFHAANHEAAERSWREEIARKPALFNGPVMLASAVDLAEGTVHATCHTVPYSTFLYWRRCRPVTGALHLFAMAVPVSSDGAVIVGRMGPQTVNAGTVYCPSGSFDPDDLTPEGTFDPDTNMHREVAEETGLDLAQATPEAGYDLVELGDFVVIARRFRFVETADVLLERARAHIAEEDQPELAEVMAVHSGEAITADFADHMHPVLKAHFGD